MIRDKSMNFSVLLVVFVAYCSSPRFCRAQGNGNGSGNPCGTYGLCGAFGICNSQVSPVCSCLQGFIPQTNQEWDSGNWTNGCVRRVPLNCEVGNATVNGGRQDGFLKLKMMKISGYSERWSGQENQCQDRCLRNCSCIAYAFDAGIGCMGWSGALMDTQKFPTGSGSDLYIRLASSELGSKKNNTRTVIIVVVVGIVIASCGAYLCWKWMAKRRGKSGGTPPNAGISGSIDSSQQDTANLEDLPLFKYEILATATNLFSEVNKLGKGGFGSVYKGELANGREIAVKRLSKASGQGMQEFMNEVVLISKLQHRNLVTLLGCCVENKETMLVYEYMPNKSLDFFLFDRSQDVLDWKRRFNIIEGICRGLLYLHRDSRLKIIHRDLKPSNILLDNHWNPKISDFGMARIYGVKQDHVSTVRVVGTYGYMAPEYAMDGRFSEKSDVYSFGVLILEIATGRRNSSYSYTHQEGSLNLVGHVWDLWKEGNTRALIDARISSSCNQSEVVRCMHIGLLCVQGSPKDRPSVSSILSMLRSETIVLPEPHESAFAPRTSRYDTGTSSSQPSQKSSSSLNNVTLTMMDGR